MTETVFGLGPNLTDGTNPIEIALGLFPDLHGGVTMPAGGGPGEMYCSFLTDREDGVFLQTRFTRLNHGAEESFTTLEDSFGGRRFFYEHDGDGPFEAVPIDRLGSHDEDMRLSILAQAFDILGERGDERPFPEVPEAELEELAAKEGLLAIDGFGVRTTGDWPLATPRMQHLLEEKTHRTFERIRPAPALVRSPIPDFPGESIGILDAKDVVFSERSVDGMAYLVATDSDGTDRMFLESHESAVECHDYEHAPERLKQALRQRIPLELAGRGSLRGPTIFQESDWSRLSRELGLGVAANGAIVHLGNWPERPQPAHVIELINKQKINGKEKNMEQTETEDYRLMPDGRIRTYHRDENEIGGGVSEFYRKEENGLFYEREVVLPASMESYGVLEDDAGRKRYFQGRESGREEFFDWDNGSEDIRDDMRAVIEARYLDGNENDSISDEQYRTIAMENSIIVSASGIVENAGNWPSRPELAQGPVTKLGEVREAEVAEAVPNEKEQQDRKRGPLDKFAEEMAKEFIDMIEKGGLEAWKQEWTDRSKRGELPLPYNPKSHNIYHGYNLFKLMMQHRSDNRWMTLRQANAQGAHVRKGERGTTVAYWQFEEKRDAVDENGVARKDKDGNAIKEVVKLDRPRVFYSTVYCADQIDGLPELPEFGPHYQWDPIEKAEEILKSNGPSISYGKCTPHYNYRTDEIKLPLRNQFESPALFYSTCMHELAHWTGAKNRLGRNIENPPGSEDYAREEVRAELGSVVVNALIGVPGMHKENNAAYINSFLKVLKNDPMELLRAAKDVDLIRQWCLEWTQEQKQAYVASHAEKKNERVRTQPQKAWILTVPFNETQDAKALGAKWSPKFHSWYVTGETARASCMKWAPVAASEVARTEQRNTRMWLAVPYSERTEAKGLGARWDRNRKSWYLPDPTVEELQAAEKWHPLSEQAFLENMHEDVQTPARELSLVLKDAGAIITEPLSLKPGYHDLPTRDGGTLTYWIHNLEQDRSVDISVRSSMTTYVLTGSYVPMVEREAMAQSRLERLEAQSKEAEKHQAETIRNAFERYSSLPVATADSAFLAHYGMENHPGMKVWNDKGLAVPFQDVNGVFKTFATLHPGDGGETMALQASTNQENLFYVVEGVLSLQTNRPIVVTASPTDAMAIQEGMESAVTAVSARGFNQILDVVQALHDKYPDRSIVVASPNIHQSENHDVTIKERVLDAVRNFPNVHVEEARDESIRKHKKPYRSWLEMKQDGRTGMSNLKALLNVGIQMTFDKPHENIPKTKQQTHQLAI